MGRSAARVHRAQRGRFLRWTGLMAGGFLGLTTFQAEGGGGGFAASFIRPPSAAPLHHFVVPLPPRRAVGGKFEGRGLLSPTKWDRQVLRATFFSSMLPAHPLPGGGWRAQRDGRGRLDGPLHGPGSEGGGGGFAASFIRPPSAAPFHHFVVPLPPRRAVGGKFEGRGLLFPPTKWDRQGLRATFFSSFTQQGV